MADELTDAIAAALCEYDETHGDKWYGLSTDEISAVLAPVLESLVVAALRSERTQNARLNRGIQMTTTHTDRLGLIRDAVLDVWGEGPSVDDIACAVELALKRSEVPAEEALENGRREWDCAQRDITCFETLVAAMRRQYPVIETYLSPEALTAFHDAERATGYEPRTQ